MAEPCWYEELPNEVWSWYDLVKSGSTEIVSVTIRIKRKQISMDYLDSYGKPKRAKLYIEREGQSNDKEQDRQPMG